MFVNKPHKQANKVAFPYKPTEEKCNKPQKMKEKQNTTNKNINNKNENKEQRKTTTTTTVADLQSHLISLKCVILTRARHERVDEITHESVCVWEKLVKGAGHSLNAKETNKQRELNFVLTFK